MIMLRRRIDALSRAQREALAESLAHEGHAHAAERLVGFVVPADDAAPTDDALRAFLAERVPDYMIPVRFVALEKLPRSAAGKLDRRALAQERGLELISRSTARMTTSPRTEIEAKLAA